MADRYAQYSDLSEDDIANVMNEIRVYETAVTAVDAEIQELAKQAAILRHKKNRFMELIAQCRGRITLALRVPDEILAVIFEHCSASGWYRAPLTLSHVCRKWRQAAMTPSVFSRVHLWSDSRDPVAKTQLWLSRALNAHLYITVDIDVIDEHVLSALDLLVNRADQWVSFELNTRHITQANDILSLCTRPIPRLFHLSLSCLDEGDDLINGSPGISVLVTVFNDAPNLRTVDIFTNRFPPQYPMQVHNLSLQLHPSATTWLAEAAMAMPFSHLSNLPSLVSLVLTTPFDYGSLFDDTTPMTTLPHLEHLTLNSHRASMEILRYITAPRLRSLRIRSTEPPLSHPHEPTGLALLQFLRNSSPPLNHLELHDVDIPLGDYLESFTLLPALETLRLHETEIPDEAFIALHGSTGLCPNLIRLDLRWCEQLAGSALVDFVASRRSPHYRPIEFIRVINCAVVKENDVLALARMTTCSVVVKEVDDYCRSKGCCNNARYRQRMRLRHINELSDQEEPLDLILN
ncbi:hypothetical protein K488DRAFT_57957 [Vararia minispora EC-137]|uniref:Uncharacterized protein n=1 Tax=Vararia minispora EC-137 TaxID=1314806 RepID=A0ACB8QAC8_9AGAM|nr:hypothetical protein K488DRAFT_57957 [Vararia minispora EC-137]